MDQINDIHKIQSLLSNSLQGLQGHYVVENKYSPIYFAKTILTVYNNIEEAYKLSLGLIKEDGFK